VIAGTRSSTLAVGGNDSASSKGAGDSGRLCILIPTTDRHVWLARFTAARIRRLWRNPPPIRFCGVSGADDECWLPLRNDPADWIGIAASAVEDLKDNFDRAYLVLDDHPPLWRCHEVHLNHTLPRLLGELEATYIGLNGWGPGRRGRRPNGEILDKKHFRLERVSDDFRWKYSLHPGLWDLAGLAAVLEISGRDRAPQKRTAWYFERTAGKLNEQLPLGLRGGAYRVCGGAMTRGVLRLPVDRFIAVLLTSCSAITGRLAPMGRWSRLERLQEAFDQYYEGPYPLFWSGVLQKGALNSRFFTYLACHAMVGYRRELLRAYREQAPSW